MRRLKVFTGSDRRREWLPEEKAQIGAETTRLDGLSRFLDDGRIEIDPIPSREVDSPDRAKPQERILRSIGWRR